MLSSATLVLTDSMYKAGNPVSIHSLNIILFTCSLSLHLFTLVPQFFSDTMSDVSVFDGGHLAVTALPFLEAFRDIMSLYVIFRACPASFF
jgi:hypothetical protein